MKPETIMVIGLSALVVSVLVSYFLFRWVFSIKRQLWNQRQQINLLVKIANKLGANDEEISNIREKNNSTSDSFL